MTRQLNLRARHDMERRLRQVSSDPLLVRHVFPVLLHYAGSHGDRAAIQRLLRLAFLNLENVIGEEATVVYEDTFGSQLVDAIVT